MGWVKDKHGDWEYEFTSPKMEKAGTELLHWLSSETREFNDFICRLIASIPGGEEMENLGYKPVAPIGWQEVELITDILDAIQSDKDTEEMADALIGPPDEEGELEEE